MYAVSLQHQRCLTAAAKFDELARSALPHLQRQSIKYVRCDYPHSDALHPPAPVHRAEEEQVPCRRFGNLDCLSHPERAIVTSPSRRPVTQPKQYFLEHGRASQQHDDSSSQRKFDLPACKSDDNLQRSTGQAFWRGASIKEDWSVLALAFEIEHRIRDCQLYDFARGMPDQSDRSIGKPFRSAEHRGH